MKCSKCGTENREEALFCKKCGSKIVKKEKKTDSETMMGKFGDVDSAKKRKCSKCGTENREEALFCKKCGNELSKKRKEADSEVLSGKKGDTDSSNWFFPAGDL